MGSLGFLRCPGRRVCSFVSLQWEGDMLTSSEVGWDGEGILPVSCGVLGQPIYPPLQQRAGLCGFSLICAGVYCPGHPGAGRRVVGVA